jgi:hypothetical protein
MACSSESGFFWTTPVLAHPLMNRQKTNAIHATTD